MKKPVSNPTLSKLRFQKPHTGGALPALLFLVVLLMACANIGTPDGGPYDETPPRVVRTSPRFGATSTKATKIVLEFDENIQLSNAMDKVVISPPQANQPEIEASGKKITIRLRDSLVANATYTIDFSDAISDNNEGNPMGDYAFAFSTGETVDTFQMSGHVLDASNLEPIKGMLVGLYTMEGDTPLPDSVFRTKPFERVSRTDSRGHFVVKGVAPGNYRVFALQDQDQNFMLSQKSEMLAFSSRVVSPSAQPDIRPDTIWHDSIHYDSIIHTPYTHFYPDDIVLLAFQESRQNRALLKSERPQLEKFTLYFTAPDTTLPVIRGLNFDAADAFVIEKNATNDTLTYWIRDSLIYNNDSLELALTYRATDTLGQLLPHTDTLTLASRVSYGRVQKQRQQAWEEYAKQYRKDYKQDQKEKRRQEEAEDEEAGVPKADRKKKRKEKIDDEDIVVPPMPESFLEVRASHTSMSPDQNYTMTFPEPIDTAYATSFHFAEVIDTTAHERPFLLQRVAGKVNAYRLYAEWQPEAEYELLIDTGAVVSIYGKRMAGTKRRLKIKSLDEFSTLFVRLQQADPSAVVQLIDQSDKVVKQCKAKNGAADFYFLNPGEYYLRTYYDRNGDGEWTTGEYDARQQAEEVFYYPDRLNLRAQWEVTQDWNPRQTPVPLQKPKRITKQKPDRERTTRSRNAERERQKRK